MKMRRAPLVMAGACMALVALALLMALVGCAGPPVPAAGGPIPDSGGLTGGMVLQGACIAGIVAIGVVTLNPGAIGGVGLCT